MNETQQLTLQMLQAKATAFDKITALESQLNQADSTIRAIIEAAKVDSVKELLPLLSKIAETKSEDKETESEK